MVLAEVLRVLGRLQGEEVIAFSRTWAMASPNTFSIKPIQELLSRWLSGRKLIVDPFAREAKLAHLTNDLNPNTSAKYHLDSEEFLLKVERNCKKPDVVLFDPPYSPRQVKECYEGFGRKMTHYDTTRTARWSREKEIVNRILTPDGIVISFGWHTCAMGKKHGFEPVEILIVGHGAAHNDTLVTVERRVNAGQDVEGS